MWLGTLRAGKFHHVFFLGHLYGNIIYKCWIFNQAMFDYHTVSIVLMKMGVSQPQIMVAPRETSANFLVSADLVAGKTLHPRRLNT